MIHTSPQRWSEKPSRYLKFTIPPYGKLRVHNQQNLRPVVLSANTHQTIIPNSLPSRFARHEHHSSYTVYLNSPHL